MELAAILVCTLLQTSNATAASNGLSLVSLFLETAMNMLHVVGAASKTVKQEVGSIHPKLLLDGTPNLPGAAQPLIDKNTF